MSSTISEETPDELVALAWPRNGSIMKYLLGSLRGVEQDEAGRADGTKQIPHAAVNFILGSSSFRALEDRAASVSKINLVARDFRSFK